jgi:dual-specificity kinase
LLRQIIRPVAKYIDSARVEKEILKAINRRDEKDEEGVVRYRHSFFHNGHFCLVFNPLGASLYDLIKKNNYRGFPLKLVQSFLRQIFKAVAFVHRLGYTHTDLKPENILL